MEKRFYYARSFIYGWCVYDRRTHTPAYEACAEYLPKIFTDGGIMVVDPTNLTEAKAMLLCHKLNRREEDQ